MGKRVGSQHEQKKKVTREKERESGSESHQTWAKRSRGKRAKRGIVALYLLSAVLQLHYRSKSSTVQ